MIDLWLYGTHLATIKVERASRMRLSYSDAAIERWGLGSRVFTVAEPMGTVPLTPAPTAAIVEGLLPEGEALKVLTLAFGGHADLLLELGRDTIGAIIAVPEGEVPAEPDLGENLVPLTELEVAARIRGLDTAPLGVAPERTVRLSIAGAQPKLPLVRVGDTFADPTFSHPSDVILKPEPGSWPRLAELEHWGLGIMSAAGVPVPNHDVRTVDGIQILVIDRYDRKPEDDPSHVRLHQEDLCMALGARPKEKYAKSHRAPTSLRKMALAIYENTDDPNTDVEHFIAMLIVNVAIGNCDAHARNTSLIHEPDGTIRLAPAYDVIPTYHYRDHDRLLAQPINRNVMRPESVTGPHLRAEVDSWGLPNLPAALSAAYERVSVAVSASTPPPDTGDLTALLSSFARLMPT